MNKENIQRQEGEKVVKIRIPDRDMSGWIETLRNGGLNDGQIDLILAHLNKTYAEQKGVFNEDIVDEEMKKLERHIFEIEGRGLTKEQRDYLRKGIEDRFRNKK